MINANDNLKYIHASPSTIYLPQQSNFLLSHIVSALCDSIALTLSVKEFFFLREIIFTIPLQKGKIRKVIFRKNR